MRIVRGIAAFVLVFALAVSAAGCDGGADLVARVNGEDITRAEFDRLWEQFAAQFGGTVPEEQAGEYRQMLLDYMIESVLVRQEAERLGADMSEEAVEEGLTAMMGGTTDTAAFEQRVEEAGLTMDDLRSSVRDQIANEFLAEYVAGLGGPEEITEAYSLLEHILVSDEATAALVIERLDAGEEFAVLAGELSIDTYSAAEGGSLGWAPSSTYVPEFADAADALAVGATSEPVQSEFGWHIIRKVDEVPAGTPIAELPEDLKAQVDANSADLAFQEYVAGLREGAEIEYLDDTLAPAE